MSRMVIGVADTAFGNREEIAADFADRAEVCWVDLSGGPATTAATEGVDAVVVTLQRLSADVLECFAPSVRLIGRAGVGLDTIDLATAAARGIAVINQPAYGAPEVASHALALLLALQRRLMPADRFVRADWSGPLNLAGIKPLDETRLAVVGGGRIGGAFIDRAKPLVGEVVVYDPGSIELSNGVRRAPDLASALAGSDALSLHLPLVDDTKNLIGAPELSLLAPGAIVINVSRGGIIDEDALADQLHSGHIGGAGLDVFAEEPLPATSPLLSAPNTLLTPHCAAASVRAAYRLSHWTISDSIEYLTTGSVSHGTVVIAPQNRPEAVAPR